MDDMPEIHFQPFAAGDFHAIGIQAQQMQNRGVHIGDVVAVFCGMEPDFVGGSMDGATFDASARHPDAKSVGMVVAAVGSLSSWSAPELSGEHDDGLVKQPALLQIFEEAGNGQIHLPGEFCVIGLEA